MGDARAEFIDAIFWGHGSREKGDAVLAANPRLASSDIHLAAIVGDDDAVRRFLAADPSSAKATSGPLQLDPLTYLCFSVYLRDESRSDAFVRSATALLDAGADINARFHDDEYDEWESLIYGAAGVAHHPALTKLLLDRGADPNDNETPYHSPETRDNRALQVLLDSGKLTADSMNMMLLRKTDWHDYDGLRRVLDAGADPNRMTRWGKTALHNALLSNNDIELIDLLLERGADPTIVATRASRDNSLADKSSVALAARRGRADARRSFQKHGFAIALTGVEHLLAACALDDQPAIDAITANEPTLVTELLANGSTYLGEFVMSDNVPGIARLLALGVPVDARFKGDGYFGIAKDSTPLHVAAWIAWQDALELLIARGADVNAVDGSGKTPLRRAVDACLVSYWTGRRTPDGVRALLAAGATKEGISLPTGYGAIDALLA
jgi:ankyrin repeat protein